MVCGNGDRLMVCGDRPLSGEDDVLGLSDQYVVINVEQMDQRQQAKGAHFFLAGNPHSKTT